MTTSTARAGALAAGLVAPIGFEPSLMPRTAVQQGLVTGLSASMTLGAVALGQAVTDAGARRIAVRVGADPQGSHGAHAAANAVALGVGIAAQHLLKQRAEEPMRRAIGRTAAYELSLGAGSALAVRYSVLPAA